MYRVDRKTLDFFEGRVLLGRACFVGCDVLDGQYGINTPMHTTDMGQYSWQLVPMSFSTEDGESYFLHGRFEKDMWLPCIIVAPKWIREHIAKGLEKNLIVR